jgi:hypothetical protein
MLKHLATLCMFLVCALQSKAQLNLVPNGSFNEDNTCVTGISQIHFAKPWFSPTQGTPDLFDECTQSTAVGIPSNVLGYQYPRTGNSYAGLHAHVSNTVENREYIAVKLISPLDPTKTYHFTMYCSLSDIYYDQYVLLTGQGQPVYDGVYTTSSIGVYFSADSIFQNNWLTLPYIPQILNPESNIIDSISGWKKIEGIYTPTIGGEQYIIIGNFKNNANTPYTELYDGLTGPNIIYFYIDDVTLIEHDGTGLTELKGKAVSIFPNPAAENVTITLPSNTNKAELLIYTAQGQLLSQTQISSTQTINTSSLANGLYLFVIQSNGKTIGREKVIMAN